MTLNASGPLSFGGATTGQSINLELGVSATALASINSTSFRTLAGVASGQISVSNFYGKSNARGWIAIYGNYTSSGAAMNGAGITTDSSGNLIVTGCFSANVYGIVKLSTTPTILAQNSYNNFYTYQYAFNDAGTASPTVDSSGNIWVTSASQTSSQNFLMKFSSSLVPDNTINQVPMNNGNSVIAANATAKTAVDSSGNIFVSFSNTIDIGCCSTTSVGFSAKYSSTLNTVTWRKQIYPDGLRIEDQALDSSGNLWIIGSSLSRLIKLAASSGAYTAQGIGNATPKCVALDSSGNKYIGSYNSPGCFNLMKVNSSGSIVWARQLSNGRQGQPKKVIVGGDGYIYMVGTIVNSNTGPQRYGFIVKYDSSGTIQWQRFYYNPSPYGGFQYYTGFTDCVYTATGLAVCGMVNKSTNNSAEVCTIALLPLDGSGTGTYSIGSTGTSITYAAGTLTEAADTTSNIYTVSDGTATAFTGGGWSNTASTLAYSVYSASV